MILNPQQLNILQTVVNIIIPPDADCGGWEGGVGEYLFHQFEGDLKQVVGLYQQGLLALDAEAVTVTGKHLAELDTQSQEALLLKIERGEVHTSWPIDPVGFFAMLVEHCAEGFYSDPGNKGNRDGAAWKMIGFEVTK